MEEHRINGKMRRLLVHRKGSTRAFPPHHPLIPVDYQLTGQPVLIGGTMGTCSYVLTGTQKGMQVFVHLALVSSRPHFPKACNSPLDLEATAR